VYEIAQQIATEHNGRTTLKCWNCGFEQPTTFGEMVKYWRDERTAKAAGEAAGLSAATISRLETGELPDMKTFVLLVQAMKVTPEFAFDLIRKQVSPDDALPAAPMTTEQP
jgi:transcriptional regulator with XRE-family HTH domain